jgi:uncharacterized protein
MTPSIPEKIEAQTYTAFEGHRLLTHGPLEEVVLDVKRRLKAQPEVSVLVFSDTTGKQMDFDLRGSDKEVLQRLEIYRAPALPEAGTPSGPGRPKLGVVAREVSLLPRHWEWLSTQTGGASATLRRLIEEARKGGPVRDQHKQAQERTHKFMSSLAGDLPGYEEALRALYGRDRKRFLERIHGWPEDLRFHAAKLAEPAF